MRKGNKRKSEAGTLSPFRTDMIHPLLCILNTFALHWAIRKGFYRG